MEENLQIWDGVGGSEEGEVRSVMINLEREIADIVVESKLVSVQKEGLKRRDCEVFVRNSEEVFSLKQGKF